MHNLFNKKIVIVGLGLIGGSIAKALTKRDVPCEIVAVGRNELMLQKAISAGDISAYTTDTQVACADADLIILAVPVLSIKKQLELIAPVITEKTVITDVASVKQAVVEAATEVFQELPRGFVPGHPIAGSEQSGYTASLPDLFVNRKVILTPLENSDVAAIALVSELWETLGAEVLQMSVGRHDEVLAATSHLPHLLAFALVDTLSQQGASEEIFRYAAGGFRDFTRIASSDPVMWRDIFLTNGAATVKVLDEYVEDLKGLREALIQGDAEQLFETFKRAKQSRDGFMQLSAKTDKQD